MPEPWRQFHRPAIPFTSQVALILLILCPLIVLRQFEKPRRRLVIWVCDLSRLGLGYATAEVLLLLLVIPFSSLMTKVSLPVRVPNEPTKFEWRRPDHTRGQGMDPGPQVHPRGAGGHHSPMKFQLKFQLMQTTSLTMSVLELFPGIFFIFGLYFVFLHLLFRAKLYWYKTLRRPRLVHHADRGWVIERGVADEHNDVDYFFDPDSVNTLYSSKERSTRARFGVVSGHYGRPFRAQWLVQQSVCLALSVFIVRTGIVKTYETFPNQIDALRLFLFGWSLHVDKSFFSYGRFVTSVIIPGLLLGVQFTISDYVLRYRSVPGQRESFVLPMHSLSTDYILPARRSYNRHADNGAFELQELRLPVVHTPPEEATSSPFDGENEDPISNEASSSASSSLSSTFTNASSSSNSSIASSNTFMIHGQQLAQAVSNKPQTPANQTALAEDIYELRSLANTFNATTVRPSIDTLRVGINNTYGIVTASLLNAAAVSATANARSHMFAARPQRGLDELDTDNEEDNGAESDSDEGDEDDNDADVDGETGEVVLPSYDDSQRQHRELLQNNPLRALSTNRVIQQMKQ